MSVFTVSPRFLVSRRTYVVLLYACAYALCALAAIFRGGGPAVESAQRTICCLFTTLSLSVVHHTLANLQYRLLTFRVFWTSPLPQRATVATCIRRASLSVSKPSAMRRALGRSRRGSLWWSPPPPGRGRGTGSGSNPFGAPREQGVRRWTTPPTGIIPAPSGAAATTTCQRACSRLVVAGVRSGPSPIVRCRGVLVAAPALGPEWTNALWRRLRSVPVARPFTTPAGNAWQNLLPPLPRTLGVLVLLSRLRLPMVAQGVWAHGKWYIPQSTFAVKSPSTALSYLSYFPSYFLSFVFANARCSSRPSHQQSPPRPFPATTGTVRVPRSGSST